MSVHAGWEEGVERGEKWLPLRLGEMKSPQSLERRKTLAGQKSNSQGHLRERERGKSTKLFFPLQQIVYVVKPETWCGNSELQYMKCTFNAVANFWETCKRLVESFFFFRFQSCFIHLLQVLHHVLLFYLILVKFTIKCNCILCD